MSRSRNKNKRSATPIIFVFLGAALFVAALILGLPRNRNSAPAATAPQEHSAEDTFPEIQRVSLADAQAAYDNSTAVFLDVRDASSYAESHIPGALSIPLAELDERLDELNRSEWIVTYCT